MSFLGPNTLQSAATATGNGQAFSVASFGSAGFQVTGTFSATISWEGTIDGTNWVALYASNLATAATATTATTTGVYVISCASLMQIRARISSYTSGSVTVSGFATDISLGGGASGSLPSSLGQKTMSGSLSVAIASDQTSIPVIPDATEVHLGQIGGSTARIYLNPTITAGAYSAGDVVGGRLTYSNWSRISGGASRALGVHLVDVANVKADLDFLLFDSLPTANLADNAVWAWNSADYDNCVMHFSILSTEYTSVGGVAVCSKTLAGFPMVPSGSANMYGYIVCRGTPTYAATTNLHISFGPDRD